MINEGYREDIAVGQGLSWKAMDGRGDARGLSLRMFDAVAGSQRRRGSRRATVSCRAFREGPEGRAVRSLRGFTFGVRRAMDRPDTVEHPGDDGVGSLGSRGANRR